MATVTTFDLDSIKAFAREFERIFYTEEAELMASYYTDTARLIGDGFMPIQGRESIEKFWQATCARGKQIDMKRSIEINETQVVDTLGYAFSTLTIELNTPQGAMLRTTSDITIWRKQEDGTWKIEVDISTPNPAA
jgi:uncharacterized protein (TIGR02246 family)